MRCRSSRSVRLAACLASAVLVGIGSAAESRPSFVGCPSDGMSGPARAPRRAPNLPPAPKGASLYASDGLLTIAPTGWHCAGLYGSNGSLLIVTPGPISPKTFMESDATVSGPVVMIRWINGDTSGRFEAADVAARVFPSEAAFIDRVRQEARELDETIASGPTATDEIVRRSPTVVEYVTPAATDGIGIVHPVVAAAAPIRGAIVLQSKSEMNIVQLVMRLDPPSEGLAKDIVAAFERDHGSWPEGR